MNPGKTQDEILFYLKMNGVQSASVLAKVFQMTGEGMRLHLQKLEKEGFIVSASQVKGVGRPTILFSLTEKGSKRFPDNHASLVVQLLKNIRQVLGQEALDKLIQAKRESDFLRYEEALKECCEPSEKLALFAQIRTQEGYMAELEKVDEGWLFIENNCPICAAAINCQGFCESEMENIRKLLGNHFSVEREDHTAGGDRRCLYHIH